MKLRYIAVALAAMIAAAALSATAHAQAPLIERVKLTDNEMSCQMIYGEIRQMDMFIASAAPAAAAPVAAPAPVAAAPIDAASPVARAVAQQAVAQAAARSGFGGLFGGLSAVSHAQQAAAAQQSAAQAPAPAGAAAAPAGLAPQAQARKEHLTSLFLAKGCKLSEVQR